MLTLLAVSAGDVTTWLLWAGASILGMAALLYLGAPLLIYNVTRFNSADVFEEIDVEELRPEAHEHFARAGDQLLALGYQPWLTLRVRGYAKGAVAEAHATGMVYANRPERTLALVSALFQPTPDGKEKILLQAEFSSDAQDGVEYNTTNTRGVAQDAPDAKVTTVQAPGVDDLRRLRAIHLALCKGRLLRELPGEDDLIGELNGQLRAKLARREAAGILRREHGGAVYRPTMWGAYVLTWRLLPPYNWLYWRRHRALVRRLEREAAYMGGC